MNCVIIDDEPLAIQLLETYVQRLPAATLAGAFTDPMEALPLIESGGVDLLLMDIQMPDISGLSFYRTLKNKPEVIFTSAYSEFALEGFELEAIDYLLKPVSFERFVAAFNRASEYIELRKNKNIATKDYFFINVSHKICKIYYRDILYLEGCKDYTKIHLQGQSNALLTLNNLKYFEDFLPRQEFIRIHRSYIISLSHLNTVTRKAVSVSNLSLPVSDMYRDQLFKIIGQ